MARQQRAISIEGLATLNRAFAAAEQEMGKDFRDALKSAAEPVRSDAESLARHTIRQGVVPWSDMRVGVTRTSVYVAPRQRGTRNPSLRRRNFAPLLLGEAMIPALERNRSKVIGEVKDALADMAKAWGRVG